MKYLKKSHRSYLKIAAIILAGAFALNSHAEPPRDEVAHAYRLLKTADHDYAGHKAIALAEVQAAAHDLHLELGGALEERERQWKSDAQLIEARRLLSEARNKLERQDRELVAVHLDKALSEINAALKVK